MTPEWQLARKKVQLARQREQLTCEQTESCLGANTPVEAMRRLHAYQRLNTQPISLSPTPQPPVMNRTLGTIVGLIVGIILGGFAGWLIASAFGFDLSTATGYGSLGGVALGIVIGRYFTRPLV